MALTHISLENITIKHLQQLIDGKSNESRYIDYKKGTYVKADDKTKSNEIHIEFLKDISSFANSDGGDIIIGMTETNGIPESFCPFNGDADKERLRLQQMAQSGLKPQIFNLQTRQIPYESGHIIIIRIPRSYHLPHQISFNNYNRYCIRANNGKYEPDVTTLRYLFNATTQFEYQVRNWRDERIDKISSKRTPIVLNSDKAILAIHLIPYSINDFNARLDLTKIEANKENFLILYDREADSTNTQYYCNQSFFNFDGYLFYSNSNGKNLQHRAYTQVFRSGAIESVATISLNTEEAKSNYAASNRIIPKIIENNSKIKGIIPIEKIQKLIVDCTWHYISGLNKCEIVSPIVMSVSLLNIKDYVIGRTFDFSKLSDDVIPQQEENLVFTEIVLTEISPDKEEHKKLLRPLLDHLANTIGIPNANFDA